MALLRRIMTGVSLLAALAGCGNVPAPFGRGPSGGNELVSPPVSTDPDVAEFLVVPPVGPSPETAGKMAITLALALGVHGIAATTRPSAGLKRITATVRTNDAGQDIAINIAWNVLEANGKSMGSNEQRALGKPQDWADGEDRLISRISTQAAFRIARQLGRGDPANVPLAALPDALPGIPPAPNAADANASSSGPPADGPPGAPDRPGAPSAIPGGSLPTPALAAASKAPRVLVSSVTGTSGSKALTSAMRRALGESQMVLIDGKEPGSFEVQGTVELAPPLEGRQRVVIRWFVRRADGTQIGDLEQANTVAAGTLDSNWDKLAPIVALAAVDAVVELISRDRGSGSR